MICSRCPLCSGDCGVRIPVLVAVLTPTCLLTGPGGVGRVPLGEGELRLVADLEVGVEELPPVEVPRVEWEEDMVWGSTWSIR